jgi:hypothetical protein
MANSRGRFGTEKFCASSRIHFKPLIISAYRFTLISQLPAALHGGGGIADSGAGVRLSRSFAFSGALRSRVARLRASPSLMAAGLHFCLAYSLAMFDLSAFWVSGLISTNRVHRFLPSSIYLSGQIFPIDIFPAQCQRVLALAAFS